MPRLRDTVRVTSPESAVWRVCAGCGLLAPLPPELDRCDDCQPAAGPPGRTTAEIARGGSPDVG